MTYAEIKDSEFVKMIPIKGTFTFEDGSTTGNIECFSEEELKGKGIVPYVDITSNFNPRTQSLGETTYSIVKGKVTTDRKVLEKTTEELDLGKARALKVLRAKRDILIKESDFAETTRQFTTEQRQPWLDYRDALFDLPNNLGETHPDDVEFPTTP